MKSLPNDDSARGGLTQVWDFFYRDSLRAQKFQMLIALVFEGFLFQGGFTFYDIVSSIQLPTNCYLNVCIFESRHDIKNLAISSVSVPLKTLKTKFEVIPPNDVEGDTF